MIIYQFFLNLHDCTFNVSGDLLDLQVSQQPCFIKNKRGSGNLETDSNNNNSSINKNVIII